MSENSFTLGEDTLISGPLHLAWVFFLNIKMDVTYWNLDEITGICSLTSSGDSGCNPDLESARVLVFQILRYHFVFIINS